MDDRGVYLYGFTPPWPPFPTTPFSAWTDSPWLCCWSGRGWQRRTASSASPNSRANRPDELRNLDWVISHACHHEQVVERLMARAAVLPVASRFGLFLRRGPVPHAGSSAKGHLPIPGPYRGQGGVGRQSLPRYPIGRDTTHPGRSVAGRAEPPVTGFSQGACT